MEYSSAIKKINYGYVPQHGGNSNALCFVKEDRGSRLPTVYSIYRKYPEKADLSRQQISGSLVLGVLVRISLHRFVGSVGDDRNVLKRCYDDGYITL